MHIFIIKQIPRQYEGLVVSKTRTVEKLVGAKGRVQRSLYISVTLFSICLPALMMGLLQFVILNDEPIVSQKSVAGADSKTIYRYNHECDALPPGKCVAGNRCLFMQEEKEAMAYVDSFSYCRAHPICNFNYGETRPCLSSILHYTQHIIWKECISYHKYKEQ